VNDTQFKPTNDSIQNKSDVKETKPPTPIQPPPPTPQPPQVKETTSQEVQVQKPMYDGYMLAPGVFDDLLNNVNEKISATNAQAHYNSTQHLRDQDLEQRQLQKNKKSAYTMTDASTSDAMPIPPDILFKLHFDAKRKGRAQPSSEGNIGNEKDFVNVADLDGEAVDDLLKLIEREQIKRQQPKPSEIIIAKNRLKILFILNY
jgi:hypothetical protein